VPILTPRVRPAVRIAWSGRPTPRRALFGWSLRQGVLVKCRPPSIGCTSSRVSCAAYGARTVVQDEARQGVCFRPASGWRGRCNRRRRSSIGYLMAQVMRKRVCGSRSAATLEMIGIEMLSKLAKFAAMAAVLAIAACAKPAAQVPPSGFGPGYGGGGGMVGGIGGMSYPAPAPEGNVKTTPTGP